MPKPIITRTGPGSASFKGMAFYDFEALDVFSFCPDSDDASTPATQVHAHIRLKAPHAGAMVPLVIRFQGPDTLDAWIAALIEHRTYVFGRREFSSDYEEQPR